MSCQAADQVLLDEYVALGVVSSADIAAGPDMKIEAGIVNPEESVYVFSRDLIHTESNSVRQIGVLTLQVSREDLWGKVRSSMFETLFIASLAVMATTFMIQHLLTQRLIKPVLEISNGLDKWDGNWREFNIELQRGKTDAKHNEDELDRLVHAIHGMRDQILKANSIIESKEDRLLSAARIAGLGYASYEFESGRIIECDENFASIFGQTLEDMLQLFSMPYSLAPN